MKANIKTIIEKIVSGDWGKEDVDNIGVKIIRTTNFTNAGNIDYDNIVTRIISEKNIQEKRLKKGDIIIEKSGGSPNQPVGRVVYFSDDDTEPILCNNFTSVIRCKNDVNSRYVFYYLYLNWCRGGTRKYQNKTTGILNLKLEKYLDDLNIELPSKEEQDNIVSILDKADEIRTKKRLANDKLDEFLKSTFISMFGDPVTNPKNYESSSYGNEFTISSGGTPSTQKSEYWENGNISWIGSNMCQNKVLFQNDGKFITELGLSKSSAKIYKVGTILVALVGATIGKTAFLEFETTTNQNIAGIENNNPNKFNNIYIYYHLQNLYDLFMRIGSGKFKMANLTFVRNLPINIPPVEDQNKFAHIVEHVEAQKQKNELVIEQMNNLFNSLSQRAFKGEL